MKPEVSIVQRQPNAGHRLVCRQNGARSRQKEGEEDASYLPNSHHRGMRHVSCQLQSLTESSEVKGQESLRQFNESYADFDWLIYIHSAVDGHMPVGVLVVGTQG